MTKIKNFLPINIIYSKTKAINNIIIIKKHKYKGYEDVQLLIP